MLTWFLRKWFWIKISWFKAAMNKPLDIPMPTPGPPLVPVPLREAVPGLPIDRVPACKASDIPADEQAPSHARFFKLQLWLYRVFSPMQPGLPPIDADPERALAGAYTWMHRRCYRPPELPAEYLGSPDLGSLAVRGPYAGYTRRAADGSFEWDFSALENYEVQPGLRRLGAKLRMEVDPTQRALRAVRIDSALGRVQPGDAQWEASKRLLLCAATTHLSLVAHFNHVHLAAGAALAVATRNRLPPDHALRRLLWPYVFATQQSNDLVTKGQMLPGGDYEGTFSFTFEALCRLFDDSYAGYRFEVNDPEADAQARGVRGQGFDTPTEDNLAALFAPMLAHAADYIAIYWPDEAALRADTAIGDWLDELAQHMPGGVGLARESLNAAGLARLVARTIYLVSVQHERLGSCLWDYQLWTHRQPVRVYENGQREPLDVYQRLVNANFNLNVKRRLLIHDFSGLALDPRGADSMRRFQQRLDALQTELERAPRAVWKLYPRELKVNINA
jgi:arachidonate 15-lipoxygenase